jgi:hypothetical protein
MVDIKVLAGCLPAVFYWGSSIRSHFSRLQLGFIAMCTENCLPLTQGGAARPTGHWRRIGLGESAQNHILVPSSNAFSLVSRVYISLPSFSSTAFAFVVHDSVAARRLWSARLCVIWGVPTARSIGVNCLLGCWYLYLLPLLLPPRVGIWVPLPLYCLLLLA